MGVPEREFVGRQAVKGKGLEEARQWGGLGQERGDLLGWGPRAGLGLV